jgi:nucleoside-diphosphate-sugar epimerase
MTRHLVTGGAGFIGSHLVGDRLRTAARGADGICRLAAGTGSATLRQILGPDIIKLDAFLTRGIDGVPMRCALAAGLVPFAAGIGATPTACDPSLAGPANLRRGHGGIGHRLDDGAIDDEAQV